MISHTLCERCNLGAYGLLVPLHFGNPRPRTVLTETISSELVGMYLRDLRLGRSCVVPVGSRCVFSHSNQVHIYIITELLHLANVIYVNVHFITVLIHSASAKNS